MMSIDTIRQIAKEAGAKARKLKLEPYVPSSADLSEAKDDVKSVTGHIPFLGTLVPKGWTKTDTVWFCDSSGFGAEDEPALTPKRFIKELTEFHATHPDHGYAIEEAGQFQVYVRAYKFRGKI